VKISFHPRLAIKPPHLKNNGISFPLYKDRNHSHMKDLHSTLLLKMEL